MDLRELTHHLYIVTGDLIDALDEKSMVDRQETSARVHGYFESGANTERGREMDAKRSALTPLLSSMELAAQIEMLTNEKFLILKIMDARLAGAM